MPLPARGSRIGPRPDADCRTFHWTVPGERAAVELSIARGRDQIAVVTYGAPLLPGQLAGVYVEVDGSRASHEVHDGIHPACIVAHIPGRGGSTAGTTELALVLPHMASRTGDLPLFSVSVLAEEPALRERSGRALWRRLAGLIGERRLEFPLSHFDGRAYLDANPDVADAVIAEKIPSALEHYRRYGMKEGRPYTLAVDGNPNEGGLEALFDAAAYLEANPDVAEAVRSGVIVSALDHYLEHGRREGRESFIRHPRDRVHPRATAGQPGKSWSQIGQDLWVVKRSRGKRGGYFVDIGATDGVRINNTYLLETRYGWSGICVEPDPKAFGQLTRNRKAVCSNRCLWSVTGETFEFILAKEHGAISEVAGRDLHAAKRKTFEEAGSTIRLKTTSLNDLLSGLNAPPAIDYVSLDTEGSEYEILRTFDFDRWKVALWTIEHNHTPQRAKIYQLMSGHGYKRVPARFDDWYFLPGHDEIELPAIDAAVDEGLIYDVGFHVGQDTDFYLRKGYRVVAIDANPRLVEEGRERFGSHIVGGQLVLLNVGIGRREETLPFYVNKAVSEWSSFDRDFGTRRGDYDTVTVPVVNLATIFQEHGVPYYLKLDIEGYDYLGLQSLRALRNRPKYVSVENGLPHMLMEMVDLGYRRFKFVNQKEVSQIKLPSPPREGQYVDHHFPMGATGPFGEETPGEWQTADEVLQEIKAYWERPDRNADIHGWFDLHGKL